jgi:hypothetical protein
MDTYTYIHNHSGVHEFEFTIDKNRDSYMYIGVASPDIPLDQTFCRHGAQVWYYFGSGYTSALRYGWDDVISQETIDEKVPRIVAGEKVRMILDMDHGELSFVLEAPDHESSRQVPGKLTGIKGPVVVVCCLQCRGDTVTVCARSNGGQTDRQGSFVERNKFAQSFEPRLKLPGNNTTYTNSAYVHLDTSHISGQIIGQMSSQKAITDAARGLRPLSSHCSTTSSLLHRGGDADAISARKKTLSLGAPADWNGRCAVAHVYVCVRACVRA